MAVYNNHLKEFYDGTLKPRAFKVYENSMKRYVDQLYSSAISFTYPILLDLKKNLSEAVEFSENFVASSFRNVCVGGRETLRRMNSPPDVIAGVDARCQNSSDSVRSLLELFAVLTLVLVGKDVLVLLIRAGLWTILLVPRFVVSILAAPPADEGLTRHQTSSMWNGKSQSRS